MDTSVFRTFAPMKRSAASLVLDLPPASCKVWGARQKAAVVIAVRNGTLRRSDAYDRYMLSAEELARWEDAFDEDGLAGLQVKSLLYRGRTKGD